MITNRTYIKNQLKFYKNKRDNQKLVREYGFGKYAFDEPFEKVFIFGSGYSINELKATDFDHIRQYASVGVNFWMLHPFRPDYYFVEISRDDKHRKMFFHNLSLRTDYDDIVKLYSYRIEDDGLISKLAHIYDPANIYLYNQLKMANYGKQFDYESLLDYHQKHTTYLQKNKVFEGVLNNVSSIDRIIQFAIQGGAKEVILCGVDLNRPEYFFESKDYIPDLDYMVPIGRYKDSKVHTTNDAKLVSFPIMGFIKSMEKRVDVKFYINSESSALSDFLPVYNFPS